MLKKRNRLTKRGSFTFVYNRGIKKHDGFLTLVFVAGKNLKIGFSVSNKLGNAVTRNKLKRRLRAICLMLGQRLKPSQAVIVARQGAEKLEFNDLMKSVIAVFEKADLLSA